MPRPIRLLLAALLLTLATAPVMARGGIWFGFGGGYAYPPPYGWPRPYYPRPYPYYYGPPYYGPPSYYVVPPVPYSRPPPYGWACYAGPYVCRLDRPVPLGAPCSCPAGGGTQAWGRVG
ncbi:MAG TPA: hypothetical protein VNR89_08090 [Roseomonas sp.]|nr:hypothetical protein [Roseomonas sp.]